MDKCHEAADCFPCEAITNGCIEQLQADLEAKDKQIEAYEKLLRECALYRDLLGTLLCDRIEQAIGDKVVIRNSDKEYAEYQRVIKQDFGEKAGEE